MPYSAQDDSMLIKHTEDCPGKWQCVEFQGSVTRPKMYYVDCHGECNDMR